MSEKKETQKREQTALEVVDSITGRIGQLVRQGELELPENFSAPNALKAAWLKLQETTDKSGKPALEVVTKASLANALMDMCVQGLTPAKSQVYFIVYGNKLLCQRSYMGSMALLLRVFPGAEISAATIYKGDDFVFSVNRGKKTIVKHVQTIDSVNAGHITGAYCVVDIPGRESHVEIMTMEQIKKAWQQGATKGQSPAHKNFEDRMAEKTAINRACWRLINSSNDSAIVRAAKRSSMEATDAEIEEEAATAAAAGPIIDIDPEAQEEPEAEPQGPEAEHEPEEKEPEMAAAGGKKGGPGF